MLSLRRQTLRGCLAGLLALYTPRVAVAQTSCSEVLLTGGVYSGVYSEFNTSDDRPVFRAADSDGTVYFIAFSYDDSTTSRRLEASGEDHEVLFPAGESLYEVDSVRHELAEEGQLGVPSGELEAVRSHAGATLDSCTSGAWYNFAGSSGDIIFPLYLVFDCSSHPVDINQTWFEFDCSDCSAEESLISISCLDTTSDETTMATTEDDDASLTTSGSTNCTDVMVTGGRYTGTYSWIGEQNDRPVFSAVDDDGATIALAFLYDSRRRRLETSRQNLRGDVGLSGALTGAVRNDAGVTLDACTEGSWLNSDVVADADGNSTFSFPLFFVWDCSSHPVDIDQTWFNAECSNCSAEASSISISCLETTSDEGTTAITATTTSTTATITSDDDDDGYVTTTDETTMTTTEDDDAGLTTTSDQTTTTSEDTDDEDDEDDEDDDEGMTTSDEDADDDQAQASGQENDSGDGDDSDDSSLSMVVIIGIAGAAVILVVGAIVGTWFYCKIYGKSSAPARQLAAQGGARGPGFSASTAQSGTHQSGTTAAAARTTAGARPPPPPFNASENGV